MLSAVNRYLRSLGNTWVQSALVKTFLNKVKELQSHIANTVRQIRERRLDRLARIKELQTEIENHAKLMSQLNERMVKMESELFRKLPANQYHSLFDTWKGVVKS